MGEGVQKALRPYEAVIMVLEYVVLPSGLIFAVLGFIAGRWSARW